MALRFKCAEVSVIDNNLFQDRLDGHVHLVLTPTLKKKAWILLLPKVSTCVFGEITE